MLMFFSMAQEDGFLQFLYSFWFSWFICVLWDVAQHLFHCNLLTDIWLFAGN